MRHWQLLILTLLLATVGATGGFYLHQLLATQGAAPTAQRTIALGEVLPKFELKDLSDTPTSLYQWHGKWVLVNFWASWCPPCIRELPAFEKIYQRYRGNGLIVVGIALDTLPNITAFLNTLSISYPQHYGQVEVSEMMRKLGNPSTALPYTLLIDPQGRLAAIAPLGELDYEELNDLVAPYLSTIPSSTPGTGAASGEVNKK